MSDDRTCVCWVCGRTLKESAARFVVMDDGCGGGEFECLDRRGCFFAHLDRT